MAYRSLLSQAAKEQLRDPDSSSSPSSLVKQRKNTDPSSKENHHGSPHAENELDKENTVPPSNMNSGTAPLKEEHFVEKAASTKSGDKNVDDKASVSSNRLSNNGNKRRASMSLERSTPTSNTNNTGDIHIPNRPKAPVAAFLSEESSISSNPSSRRDISAPSTFTSLSRDSDGSTKAADSREKKQVAKSANEPRNETRGLTVANMSTAGTSSSIFRPKLQKPVEVSKPPAKPTKLRASAPIFVPKPVQYPSMGYPNFSTQARVSASHQSKQHALLHATQELQKTTSDRIVRLQRVEANPSRLPMVPHLGDPCSRPPEHEMHHWDPSISNEPFQIPRFASWEDDYDAPPAGAHFPVDTSAVVRHHETQRSHHPTLQRTANYQNHAAKPSVQRPVPPRAIQAAPPAARKSHVAHGKAPAIGQAAISSRPVVFHNRGTKITMVDERRKVFIIDLLSKETCRLIRNLLDDHLEQVKESGDESKNWRTLYTYTKMDLPCSEVRALVPAIEHIMSDIVRVVGVVFGQRRAAAKLRPRSWKEPHVLLYQKVEGKPTHTGVEMHYDGCDITWQIMLSDLSEYSGGGTYIRSLRKTIKLRQGQVLVHPGELYHKGVDITDGTRLLIVGFMDGFDPKIIDDSKKEEDREEYEKNVYTF